MNLDDLQQISCAPGISSFEEGVASIIREKVQPYSDEIEFDRLGSLIAWQNKEAAGPVMAIATHMDEVGFIVKEIDKNGFIRLQVIGSIWSHMLPGQSLRVITSQGKEYDGIIGSVASHGLPADVRNKVIPLDDLYLDMGVSSDQTLYDLGIQVGDMVVPVCEFTTMNDPKYVRSKAFDNRIGVMIGIEAMKRLKDQIHGPVAFCATVQEEPGLRGARTATHATHPDLAIAIDTTLAGDTPMNQNICALGKGVSLAMIDSNSIAHRGLVRYLEKLAKELNIPFQYSVFNGGGTDSGNIHKSFEGIPNITLSIPIRYMHTNQSIIHLDDVEACIQLLVELFKNCDQKLFNQICGEDE